jgi:molybdenum cofactor cytidylyltransferase
VSATRSIIVLAAGASRRLGQPKQLLMLGGEPLIRRAVNAAIEGRLGRVYVVLAEGDNASRAALDGVPVEVIRNPDAGRGIGSSIKAAMAALPRDTHEAVLMVVDQPAVDSALLTDLAAALRPDSLAAACEYAGTIGVPAIYRRALFDELMRIEDDAGAKSILLRHRPLVATIPFPAGEADIDTPTDAERMP